MDIQIKKQNGKYSARIEKDGFSLTLFTCVNGWQSTGQPVNIEVLKLVREAIDEFLENK